MAIKNKKITIPISQCDITEFEQLVYYNYDSFTYNLFQYVAGITKSEVKEDVKSTEDVSAAFDDLFNN